MFASIEHHPFTLPGKSFDGSTVVLRVVDGDWHAAGRVYRDWFEKTFGICKPSDCWIRRESFFQMTMFELPEGTICYRFKDIPQWAKDAKDHGVNSLMISGWQHGGHDNGYPDYTPDPRLGTWQELEDGIKACHALGMKVYFFVNYQQVMLDFDWYKKELSKYREWGPNGEITWNVGWGMGTLWARMDHPKRMTGADPAFPRISQNHRRSIRQAGRDRRGWRACRQDVPRRDGLQSGPSHESRHRPLGRRDPAHRRKSSPPAASTIPTGRCRSSATGIACCNSPARRGGSATNSSRGKVFPEHAETQMIAMAYDYLGVNNLVRDGHIVMVAPLNFCRSMGWKPWEGLADYIKEVKRIRDELDRHRVPGRSARP